MRFLRSVLMFLLLLAVAGLALGTWTARRSFPPSEGEMTLAALDGPVTVARDEAGVPHITATTLEDLFRAQGYVHAQDRFWQMDTWRHIGAGRLGEMFGEGQVETDAFLRTLGFEGLAAETYSSMPAGIRSALDSYAEGVNAYLEERPGGAGLSLEYAVLGLQNGDYEPARWEPVHSLTWAHVMAWDLRSNLEHEIERSMVAGRVGRGRVEDLFPPHPEEHPVIVGDGTAARFPDGARPMADATDALARVAANAAAVRSTLGRPFQGLGSNSWVVDGTRTASGLPLLANDPHLGIQLPSIWYQATLWCEDVTEDCPLRVSGFTFPGAPAVVVGHNQRIAWGVTNQGADTMDLFIERTDGERYLVGDEWREYDTRTETIEAAGGEDVTLEIRSTRHGPIVSGRYGAIDDLDDGGLELPGDYEVALAWQALEPSTLFQSVYEMNLASNWEEFRRAASYFDIAAQNLVYADVDGHIGYQATGEIPVRRTGDGRYPVPGWTSEYGWEGLVPFQELPHLLDPPAGMIVTANQPVVEGTHPVFIGVDHDYGYRMKRIMELIEDSSDLTARDFASIQMDNYDASASFVVPAVLELTGDEPAMEQMQDLLGIWSHGSDPYQMDADSPAAAAYAATWRHLLMDTFEELPSDHSPAGNSRYFEVIRDLLSDPSSPWWDDTGTEPVETAPDILGRATLTAHEELTSLLGEDPSGWRWGDLHRASFDNQTLGQSGIGPIEAIFNRTAPARVSGGSSIVNATGWHTAEGYDVLAVPSMRMVVDLADFDRSLAVHTTGQSGHAFHPNYFDLVDDWADGRMRPLYFAPDDFPVEKLLRLTP